MNCAKYEPLIALYVENDLAEAEAHLLESHLGRCDECREFAENMRESQAALKSLRLDSVEDVTLAEIRLSVMEEISKKSPAPAWRGYAIAAMLVIGLVAGWLWRVRTTGFDGPQIASSVIPPPPPHEALMFPAVRHTPRVPSLKKYRLATPVPPATHPAAVAKSEPLLVKLITDDPQVVIYWLVDQNGG